MRYSITRSEAGDFVVSELRPVVLGHFVDQAMAAFFVEALERRPGEQLGLDLSVTMPPVLPAAPSVGQVAPPPVARPSADKVPAGLADGAPLRAPDIPTETLEAAFRRLDAGEKLADVSVALGLSMGRLRGYWALECKRRRAADQEEIVKASCRLCGAEFVPSAQNLETCARCSR